MDNNFKNYYGKWIHINISSYISEDILVFSNKFTQIVNNIDITPYIDFTIPSKRIKN